MASQLTLFGDSMENTTDQVNTEKLLSCTRATNEEGVTVLEVWSIFPFAIKRILGISLQF